MLETEGDRSTLFGSWSIDCPMLTDATHVISPHLQFSSVGQLVVLPLFFLISTVFLQPGQFQWHFVM